MDEAGQPHRRMSLSAFIRTGERAKGSEPVLRCAAATTGGRMSFILALDQATTSSRAILFDHGGQIRAAAQRKFRQIFPQAGWVEHDPAEIWSSQLAVAQEALAKATLIARDIAATGITNQRETTILWNRRT